MLNQDQETKAVKKTMKEKNVQKYLDNAARSIKQQQKFVTKTRPK